MTLTLLAGGVGGGRMADGFYPHLGDKLTVVVNIGDDFEMHGLTVCPDLDTVLYTLSGLGNLEQGWGLTDESFRAHQMLSRLGLPDWFLLGDQDLAVQIARSHWLRQGLSLTEVMACLAQRLNVGAQILPMSDQRVSTWVEVAEGPISFQDYFVKRRHQDPVRGFRFEGLEDALPGPRVLPELNAAGAVILAPSNPFVSLDPILALPGVRSTLATLTVPRVAISPIVGGQSIKGPAAHMMRDLGWDPSCRGIADYYRGLLDGIVIDSVDRESVECLQASGLKVLCTDTIMRDRAGRAALAGSIMDWLRREFRCEL